MLYKHVKNKKIIDKLTTGKADDNEWIYGKIPTQCDSCSRVLSCSFIAGWDESIFTIMCPDCFQKCGGELRDVRVYDLGTLKIANDGDTPEKREKSQRFRKLMGWG
jgi:hypothetical protein